MPTEINGHQYMNVADAVMLRDAPLAGIIQDTAKEFPLFARLPVQTVPGIHYNMPVVTGLPRGAFRPENKGKHASAATIRSQPVVLRYFDCSMGPLDVSVAQADANGVEAAITFATKQAMLGMEFDIEEQILYGDSSVVSAVGAAGFDGLRKLVDPSMVVDAGGTMAGGCSDFFLINFDLVKLILGKEGTLRANNVVGMYPLTDDEGRPYFAYMQKIDSYITLVAPTVNAVALIKNIDDAHPLTDDLIYRAIAKFKPGHNPTVGAGSRRVQEQLRLSRNSFNAIGTPTPTPDFVGGNIPFLVLSTIRDHLDPEPVAQPFAAPSVTETVVAGGGGDDAPGDDAS